MIRVHIANSNVLVREGLKVLLKSIDEVQVCAESLSGNELFSNRVDTDILIIDYNSDNFKVEDVVKISALNANLKILAITEMIDKSIIINALKSGVDGHLLNCCDFVEIRDALYALMNGEKFYCGKLLNFINAETISGARAFSCDPISLSEREVEIIKYIAEGLTNKEIADKIYLSTHTIMTHRKNIMGKLGVNNTAGIVIFAVKENMISPNKYLFAQNQS